MPSIENLRKQAKQIVRWHRDRHYPVAALIRTHIPAFAAMSDPDILAHRFQLTDAQELVAIRSGFSSWKALLEGNSKMPNSQASTKIVFTRAEPQLLVSDIVRSLEFFTESLGFETQFAYGEPPFYAQVARGNAHLNLRLVAEPLIDPERLRSETFLTATICVEAIKELFLEYQTKGVEFGQSLRKEPWGTKTFIVPDPDGNLILFAG